MKTLLGLLLALWLWPAAQGGEAVQLTIVQPASGAQIQGAEAQFHLAVSGENLPVSGDAWTGDGQFHVRLDGVEVLQVKDLRFSLIGIPAGQHTIEVDLLGWSGGGSNTARVDVNVGALEPAEGPRWLYANVVIFVVILIVGGLILLWLFWVRPQRLEPIYDDQDKMDQEGATGRQGPSGNAEG